MADLFSTQAQLEIGKDGIYSGRERIRAYFRAMGGGRNGLAAGRLNEHLQVMAVVTLAADGKHGQGAPGATSSSPASSARNASWGEGPTEVQYVKRRRAGRSPACTGSRPCTCPMRAAGQRPRDTNAGRFVGDKLRRMRRPASTTRPGPAPSPRPFHFRGKYPGTAF